MLTLPQSNPNGSRTRRTVRVSKLIGTIARVFGISESVSFDSPLEEGCHRACWRRFSVLKLLTFHPPEYYWYALTTRYSTRTLTNVYFRQRVELGVRPLSSLIYLRRRLCSKYRQLTASDINFTIVRPLVFKYARLRNMAVVYACLVVRSYFLAESESNLAFSGLMLSRATLCEILAMKLLSYFASNYIQLVAVLTTSWNPLSGAPPDIIQEVKQALGGHDDDMNYPQSALEASMTGPVIQASR